MALTSPDTPGAVPVTVWSLAITSRPGSSLPPPPDPSLRLVHHAEPAPDVSRELYRLVGEGWYWVDRAGWTRDQWRGWVDRPEHRLVSCWRGDDPVGYYELERQAGGSVELVYFGLVPAYHGRGIGRWLLGQAMADAWALPGTTRLWLHTCSLDGPNARANYEARGFELIDETVEYRLVPDPS